MDRKPELKRLLSEVYVGSILNAACQHYKKQHLAKQQIMPSANFCKQNHMNTRLFEE